MLEDDLWRAQDREWRNCPGSSGSPSDSIDHGILLDLLQISIQRHCIVVVLLLSCGQSQLVLWWGGG